MEFALGVAIGLLVSLLIVVTLTYFRRVIEHKTTVIEKTIENAGPRPRGFIVEPESPADEARARIIARNNAQGRPTKISDLQ